MNPERPKSTAVDWAVNHGLTGDVLRAVERRAAAARRRRWRYGTAVVAFAVIATAGVLRFRPDAAPSATPTHLAISTPERRLLPDGSTIELRPGAEISVEYSTSTRRIVLTSGEAHFEVAKDPARPFVVAAGLADVQAVGTAFTVRRNPSTVDVLVTEGQISIHNQTASAPAVAQFASAGEKAVVVNQDARIVVAPLAREELKIAHAWRVPRLELDGTALRDAVPLFNRHNENKLVLGDAKVGDLRVSGILRADGVETLVDLLRDNFGVTVQRNGNGDLVLRSRE